MRGPQYKIIIQLKIGEITAGVLEQKNGNLDLIKIETRVIPLPEKLLLKEIWRKSKEILFKILDESLRSFKRSEIMICLDLPFYDAETRVVKIARKNPFIIEKKFADGLLNDEAAIFERALALRRETQGKDFEPIEKEIMGSLLNGYPVKNINGKKVFEAELFLYFSASPKDIIDELKKETEKIQPNLKISFHTFPFIIYKTLSSVAKEKENLLIFKLGKEISEILLIEGSRIKELVSFAKGENFFGRRSAFRLNLSPEEGQNIANNYLQEKLNPEYNEKIRETMENAFKEFESDLKNSIIMLGKEYFLPYNVLILSSRAFFPKIKNILENESFKNCTILKKSFEPELLDLKYAKPELGMNPELALLDLFAKRQNKK